MSPWITTGILLCLLWLSLPSVQAQSPAPTFDRSAPAARGLVAWWRAVPGFTWGVRWYDLLGRHHGTLTNMGTAGTTSGWTLSSLPSSFNVPAEVRFDGVDDSVQIAASAALEPPATSIMLWLKVLPSVAVDYGGVVVAKGAGGYERSILVRAGDDLKLATYLFNAGTLVAGIDFGAATLTVGTWYHVAMTYTTSVGLRLYVNCVVDGTAAAGGALASGNSPWQFGVNDTNYRASAMQDVRIYNRALPQTEVCQVMRDSQLGDPTLLPPPSLLAVLAPALAAKSNFFPFFGK